MFLFFNWEKKKLFWSPGGEKKHKKKKNKEKEKWERDVFYQTQLFV